MLEELFRGNEVAQSTVWGVITSLLASFSLSFLLVLTYRLTSREVVERREFTQGLALISLVATMIMQAIGDSLARGLGMLGALSIIRFRTSLTSPRNMAFMFASLAVGIACGVFGFVIAFCGTVAFCLAAAALAFEYRPHAGELPGELRVTLLADPAAAAAFEASLRPHTKRLQLTDRRFERAKPPKTPVATSAVTSAATPPTSGPSSTNGTPTTAVAAAPQVAVPPPADPLPLPLHQVLTYAFRLSRAEAAHAIYEALDGDATVIAHRLRFSQTPERL